MEGVTNRIALIGLRGTGKTTIGQILAQRFGWKFADADDRVEAEAGKTIAQIFAEDGECVFRLMEAKAIADLCGQKQIVLATGGGAVLLESTRQLLRNNCQVVWLTGDVDQLVNRIENDASTAQRRPSLTDLNRIDELKMLLDRREPLYRETAHLMIDTTNKTPNDIADEITRQLPSRG